MIILASSPVTLGLLVVGAVLVLVLVLWLVKGQVYGARARKVESLWSALGGQMGVRMSPSSSILDRFAGKAACFGTYKGFGLSLSADTRQGGEEYLRVRLPLLSRLRIGLSLERENLVRGSVEPRWEGMKVGDAGFDETFLVVSERPELAAKVLTAELRGTLLAHREILRGRNLVFTMNSIESARSGIESDTGEVSAILELLITVAQAVSSFEAELLRQGDGDTRQPSRGGRYF